MFDAALAVVQTVHELEKRPVPRIQQNDRTRVLGVAWTRNPDLETCAIDCLAFYRDTLQIVGMASSASISSKTGKPGVLGRSAASGRFVLAPVITTKPMVSDRRITAAVKSVLAKKT